MSNYGMRNNEGLPYKMSDSKVLANVIIDISKKRRKIYCWRRGSSKLFPGFKEHLCQRSC